MSLKNLSAGLKTSIPLSDKILAESISISSTSPKYFVIVI